ncbi:MAG TPA: hypothetical protein VN657_04170 [Nitrospiraceae bacterium]|nr:hypothetical protein [Nitrospiraceae bacterium]
MSGDEEIIGSNRNVKKRVRDTKDVVTIRRHVTKQGIPGSNVDPRIKSVWDPIEDIWSQEGIATTEHSNHLLNSVHGRDVYTQTIPGMTIVPSAYFLKLDEVSSADAQRTERKWRGARNRTNPRPRIIICEQIRLDRINGDRYRRSHRLDVEKQHEEAKREYLKNVMSQDASPFL